MSIVGVLGLRFLPRRWQLACLLMLGMAAGMGALVFHISRAASYLSDAPETCMNCHVMTAQYLTWQHSSHAEVAACNDCHVPHTSLLAHWAFKAKDGLWHATVFTMRWEPQVIRLSPGAVPVVEQNCRRCHAELLGDLEKGTGAFCAQHRAPTAGWSGRSGGHGLKVGRCLSPSSLRCWECHREVPHGRVRSLSAAPSVFPPRLPAPGSIHQQPRIGGRLARPIKESDRD